MISFTKNENHIIQFRTKTKFKCIKNVSALLYTDQWIIDNRIYRKATVKMRVGTKIQLFLMAASKLITRSAAFVTS